MFIPSKVLPYYAPDADDSGNMSDADTNLEPKSKATEPKTEPTTDFEKAYKGLQKKYDILYGKYQKLDEAKDEQDTKYAELQVELDQKKNVDQKTTESMTTMQTKINTLQKELDNKSKELTRTAIVMKEFPDLSDMVDNLPEADTDEEFRTFLTNLKTAIDSKVELAVQNRLKGVSVNDSVGFGSGDGLENDTVDNLYDKLAAFPSRRSPKEQADYNKINAAYMAKIRENQNK